ncbi:MAG: aspartate ammonia-lyase [Lachnospiraceae bacterium]
MEKNETQKALENFDLHARYVNLRLIYAIATIKQAAAATYKELHLLENEKVDAILLACHEIIEGRQDDKFRLQALQGGAGTSTHMNVIEVIAQLAGEQGVQVSPLDDVNKGQSTNDVYPTALRIATIQMVRLLSEECSKLQTTLQEKETEFAEVYKLGRTQLMDAMPVTLGQEFGAYAQAIARDRWRIYKIEERLRQVNIGGTAIGTGANADRAYTYRVLEILRDMTQIGLARAEYPMDITQNQDVFTEVSGLLKALAVNLMKISTDLRLMNSGPKGGLGEITLQELQKGSTMMPGKVNPVIPEMTTQVAIRVMANDTAITMAAAHGNFELNAFLPLIADALLESLELLTDTVRIFRERCIATLQPNPGKCREHLASSAVEATALAPYIGYEEAAKIVREVWETGKTIREVVEARGLLSEEEIDKIEANCYYFG